MNDMVANMNEMALALLQKERLEMHEKMKSCDDREREMYAYHLERLRKLFSDFGFALIEPSQTIH